MACRINFLLSHESHSEQSGKVCEELLSFSFLLLLFPVRRKRRMDENVSYLLGCTLIFTLTLYLIRRCLWAGVLLWFRVVARALINTLSLIAIRKGWHSFHVSKPHSRFFCIVPRSDSSNFLHLKSCLRVHYILFLQTMA